MTEGLLSPATIFSVALGSALGGVARYWLGLVVDRRRSSALPSGTLLVNISGALVIGMLAAFLVMPADGRISMIWAVSVTGFLGSYTTVSAFSLQTLIMLREGRVRSGFVYVATSVSGCLLAATLGLFAGRFALHLAS